MAPINRDSKAKSQFKGKQFKDNHTKGHPSVMNKKKNKWIPANKHFVGSAQEGHGFAFKRKQKVQQQYNKLIKKERWKMKDSRPQTREEEYPEHLRHLYLAEQQRLEEEEQTNRSRRRKTRTGDGGEKEGESHSSCVPAELSDDGPQSSQIDSTQKQRKQKKLSSYQKTVQEYERIKAERESKREEYLKNKAQREEALKKYKEKKMATYQLLKKKTKKGQPNLNLQMELLLQKIQAPQK